MVPDVLDLPVETLEDSELGGAIACYQMITQKSLASSIQQMVRVKKQYVPSLLETKQYTVKYELYQQLIKNLDPFWSELKTLEEKLGRIK